MRILGLDYGSARIGVALGDTETKVASPWRILVNEDQQDAIERILEIARQEKADQVVIGIPRPLNDPTRETDQAKEIRVFAEALRVAGATVIEEDETLSTAMAGQQMQERGEKGKRDDLAAAVILQSYLDRYGVSS